VPGALARRNRRPITLELPILPVLQRIIDASTTGDLAFLVNEYGQPFTANGFGNRMREWCDEVPTTWHSSYRSTSSIVHEWKPPCLPRRYDTSRAG